MSGSARRGAAWTEGAGRADRMVGGPAALFAYGTLRFPEVLAVLLDRVPAHTQGTAAGWRAAALAGRVYPGLVRAEGEVTGMLITGLTPDELRLIDEYESGPYELHILTLNDGRDGWAYAWSDDAVVLPDDWSPAAFADLHLADFAAKCRAWRDEYEAAGRTGRGVWGPHDPGPEGRSLPAAPAPLSLVAGHAHDVGQLASGDDAELRVCLVEVVADGPVAEEQLRGDVAVGHAPRG
jgi:gamma-glutamylcyclotransferase (GGCT)/AIG2-like uncharacterized protein YtfP